MTQSRRMLVLRAVVEDYIRSQEPVGSTSLTRDHDLGVSSATIRNDMAALEDEGYLIQPHTSAGRVPTEKGYRYFVDRLATVVPLSEAQRRGINSFLSGSVSLKDALQRSARLLSEITGQVAVVASPSLAKATLRHVEMVPVAMTTLLAVVITDTGRVAQHGLTIASMPAVDEINRLSNTVNEQCDGLSLIRGDRAIHRRQRRLRVGAWRGRRAGRRLRIDGIGRTRERTVHVRHLAPGPLPVPGRSGPALRRAGRTGRADEAHEQPERGDECIRWAWPSAPKCTPPDYCMLPWSAVAMGAAERRANRRGTIP